MTAADAPGTADPGLAEGDVRAHAEAWVAWLRRNGRAANTIDAYAGDIAQYVRFLAQRHRTDVRDLGPDDVEDFVRWIVETPGRGGRMRADTTAARIVTAVRVFHRWLHDTGLTVDDAAVGVPPPQAVRAAPIALDRDDAAALLASVDGTDPADLRDRALLSLLVGTGIRAAEAVALDIDHVADDCRLLDVPGDRARPLPVSDPRALRTWVERGRPAMVRDEIGVLFPNARGARMTRQGVWRLVSTRAVAAGLPAGTSPRTLRNTFAELERAAGTSEAEVRALLGRRPGRVAGRPESG